jgi:phosphoglycerol transferase MdoB-like AlkP superfamily enzyme
MFIKLLPIFSTALFYLIYFLICTFKFDVQIDASAVFYDFLTQLIVGYLLFSISRRVWIFLVIQALLMGLFYIGNAVKMSFFGGPIIPDDIFALRALLMILEGWRFFAAAIPLAGIASLLLFNFSMRHWSSYLTALTVCLLGMTLIYQPLMLLEPLDKTFGNSKWNQRGNYLSRGPVLYSLQEGARFFAFAEKSPDVDEVQTAAQTLLDDAPVLTEAAEKKSFAPRNVHIVLLESFWDPNGLKKAKFNKNPLSPDFLKLWKSAGYSHALTPVFGGGTANSEFEVLCGFPVSKSSIKFERQLINSVPCLPHILADKGYRTVASHPNVPVFWNRVNAYRNIGFQTYWSKQDFLLDDMNEEFLSDASLYRQVMEKISDSLSAKQPILDYIVTYFGHWNYPLSDNRPSIISSASTKEEVPAYANTVYYKSRELMAFLEQLRSRDPEGIIVAFGDHLPNLGEGYIESEVLFSSWSKFTPEMYKFHVTTPMLIIDGKKGPVKFDNLPLYQVPKLILNMLKYDEPSIMDYVNPEPDITVRPLPGLHINLSKDKKIELCKEPPYSEECLKTARWLENVIVVSNDLFIGRQYTRPKNESVQMEGTNSEGIGEALPANANLPQ